MTRALLSPLATLFALLALAGPATAANRYVDDTVPGGNNDFLNSCKNPANPCRTIPFAVGKAAVGDTIVVGGGSYTESVTLGGGKSLVASDFFGNHTDLPAIVDNGGVAQPALRVAAGDGAGKIEGLHIRSNYLPLQLEAEATVTGNTFDEPTEPTYGTDVFIESGAGSPVIDGNVFIDSATNDDQGGVSTASTGSPVISDNSFNGFRNAILAIGGTPLVLRNDIVGTHDGAVFAGQGIFVQSSNPTLEANLIREPIGPVVGILLLQSVTPTGATLRHNRVLDAHNTGVALNDTSLPVTLDGDTLASSGVGLSAVDTGADGGGDVTATNLTAVDNTTTDVSVLNAQLTLDSSILGPEGIGSSGGSCTITHSRGPSGGSGACGTFQTSAAPAFVNPGAYDYHLQPSSPLIDLGNPAAPAAGATDLDGDARALDGNKDCAARRDMGADEVVPTAPLPDCTPPAFPGASGSSSGSTSLTSGDSVAPVLSSLSMLNRTFRVASAPTALTAKRRRAPRGSAFRYTISEDATVMVAIERRVAGRRVGTKCSKPGRKLRRKRRCVRLLRMGTLTRRSKAGRNKVAFSGRIGRKALVPGRYRASVSATDVAGNRSKIRRVAFRIVR